MVDKGGRPEITEEQKEEIVQKLEPYLKSGINITKALLQAQIPRSTFYDLLKKDPKFSDKISRNMQFLSILLNSALVKRLQDIVKKQNEGITISTEEEAFMKWFALNSNLTKEEYGERKKLSTYDPESEVQKLAKMIDDASEKGEEDGTTK